ncbi:putative oxidoreductase OrdL [Colletotrichum sp. SAR 10_76]|nr:putative oxidoreductase OrdL [Colletotrichum sp. SAR 10_76]
MTGLPVPDPCISFWQQTTRSFPYLNHNDQQPVPKTSRYVVIGSGISGALTAYKLVEGGVSGSDIVILEAREAASGASSRNAGHVRPDAFRGFTTYKKLHGEEQALKVIANERAVFHAIDEFVREHGVQCDFNPTTTFDVCLTQEFVEHNAQSLKEYREAGGDVSHIKFYTGEEAREKTGVHGALCAYEWPAGSSHPAKLAQWLLTKSIESGVRFLTHCPATALAKSQSSGSEPSWDVQTPRGTITTATVIHCTNAFASHLLPQLAAFVAPERAQAHAFVPPATLTGSKILPSTVSLRHGLRHFYSVNQRRADGIIILGAAAASPFVSEAAYTAKRTSNDQAISEEIRDDSVANFQRCFAECRPENLSRGEGLLHAWTGIIGMTPDMVPFVGKVDGYPGQWVCAGFNGHASSTMSKNLAPETPPSRGISSRLLTMKFMQRAAANGSPAESSPDEPSSKRRKFQNSPLTGDFHSFDQAAVQAALKQQDAKRLAALEASRAEMADTHWVLDGKWGKSDNAESAPPNIVYVGYADIDGPDEDDNEETIQQVGRKKIGNAKSNNAKKPTAAATSKDDSDSSGSSDSDESSDDDSTSGDEETPAKSKSQPVKGLSSGGQGRTRVNLKPKKSSESVKAQEFRDKRRKKEVKLNQLSGISNNFTGSPGGGISGASRSSTMPLNMKCHNCGKAGHKVADCPTAQRSGKRKSFQRS